MKICIVILIAVLLMPLSSWAATTIPFTITTSEAVNVTGTPRIAVDVGGVTRYATYTSGTGTSSLTFTYTMVAGDVDLDGVTLTSPMQLNGGTIKDLNGNDATLTFTVPNTSNVKVNYPSLGMDFVADADGRYTLNGTVYNDLTSFLTATGGSFTRASVGTYYDASGTLQTAASGTPRFDYDPVTHTAKGILIEESRTNLMLRGNDFTVGPWANVIGATSTRANGTLPFYPNTSIVTVTSPSGGIRQSVGGLTANQYTWSFYIESSNSTGLIFRLENGAAAYGTFCGVTFNPATGTFSGSSGFSQLKATSLNSGWFVALTLPAAGGGFLANLEVKGSNGDIFKYAMPQFEQGTFATSYIPTVATAVTRQADNLQLSSSVISDATKGSFYLAGQSIGWGADSQDHEIIAFSSLLATPGISRFSGGSIQLHDGSGYKTNQVYNNAASIKYGLAYDALGSATAKDGGSVNTGTFDGDVNLGANIGIGSVNGNQSWDGHISKFLYYPLRMTNTQLQLMTQ